MTDFADLERRMEGATSSLSQEFTGLRTGRAHISLLDSVMVEAYGSSTPLSQVGTVSTPDARMISVQVWDKSLVKSVEKAITEAGLGLNPSADGQLVRVPLPELSEERRKELVKVAHKYAEQGRVAIRNIRRDGMESLKKEEKDGEISKDEMHDRSEDVQKLTDKYVAQIDEMLVSKEADIMTV